MTTYPLKKTSYFLFQDSASEVSYACERINNNNYKAIINIFCLFPIP